MCVKGDRNDTWIVTHIYEMAHRRREVLHRLCSFGGRLSKGSNRAAAGCDAQHRGEDVEDM